MIRLLLLLLLLPSICLGNTITSPYVYGTNDTVTNVKLNSNQNAITTVVNGGLDNGNVNTTGGYHLFQAVGVLPSAGSQGAVYYLTSDNTLNFDTGSSFVKSVVVSSPSANQIPVYSGSAWVPTTGYLVPQGIIVMWSGTIATIPSGWVLCDGTNSTPDLRNRFIVAADADVASVAKSTITGSALQTSEGQLPSTTTSTMTFSKFFSATSPAPSIGGDGVNNLLTQTVSFGTGTANVARFYSLAYIMKT